MKCDHPFTYRYPQWDKQECSVCHLVFPIFYESDKEQKK